MYTQYLQMRHEAATLPHVSVTKEEFIKLLIAENGKVDRQAKVTAKLCELFGSYVRIGDRMVAIEK